MVTFIFESCRYWRRVNACFFKYSCTEQATVLTLDQKHGYYDIHVLACRFSLETMVSLDVHLKYTWIVNDKNYYSQVHKF